MNPPAIKVLLFIASIVGFVLTFTSDELRVTLTNGSKLVGRYIRSYSGRPIKSFTNIPYAKPSLGPLRFKVETIEPLEPLEKWDNEYKAIDDVPKCPQANAGTEDCLRINVYVPHSYEEKKVDLPVLVYYHYGSYVFGSASRAEYGPDYLLDHDIIIVMGNYWIGALGFLSTEDENCPGNFGLKDQVMILKWVHENIRQFGGDPDKITIGGVSAGSASVTHLMASPLTKGLFTKAIAQAGANTSPFALPAQKGTARKHAQKLAESLNCFTPNDWPKTIDCLRKVPEKNLTAASYNFEYFTDPIFKPVVEPNGPGAFMTENPCDVVTEQSAKIPLLSGINHDDGSMQSGRLLNDPVFYEKYTSDLVKALANSLYYDHHEKAVQESITNRIEEFYFNGQFSKEKETNLTNLFSDSWFIAPLDALLRLRFAHKDAAPTYVYLATHKGSASFTELMGGNPNKWYGMSHGDEMFFIFTTRELHFPSAMPTKEEDNIRKAMVELWVNFIQTGNPTPDSSKLLKWQPTSAVPVDYYRIGRMHYESKPLFGMESGGLFDERTKFWRDRRHSLTLHTFCKLDCLDFNTNSD